MAVVAGAAGAQGVEVNGGDAGGAGADDVVGERVAHVDCLDGRDAGAGECDLEDPRVGLRRADDGRVDDRHAIEPGVAQVLLPVAVGVGDDHDGEAGVLKGADGVDGARGRLAPQDDAGVLAVG